MPITFSIDSPTKAIHTKASGTVHYHEVVAHLRAKERAGLFGYAELVDAREAWFDLSIADFLEIGNQMKTMAGAELHGRIAILTDSAFVQGLGRAYAVLSTKGTPSFEIFTNFNRAQAWLMRAEQRVPPLVNSEPTFRVEQIQRLDRIQNRLQGDQPDHGASGEIPRRIGRLVLYCDNEQSLFTLVKEGEMGGKLFTNLQTALASAPSIVTEETSLLVCDYAGNVLEEQAVFPAGE
jgi:hypothetical protein